MQANFVAKACRLLSIMGGFWSIENPQASYLWLYPSVARLFKLDKVHAVDFEQCQFGLRPPGASEN